jgi:HlyD family secretion protein
MDRPIAANIKRGRVVKRMIWISGILLTIVALIWVLRNSLKTSISRDRLRLAVAEEGALESTLTASGEIIPAFEQVLTSPIQASVEEVLVNVGQEVTAGQPVLALEKAATLLDYERKKDQMELRKNNIRKLKIQLLQKLNDLIMQDSIKALRIKSLVNERDTEIELIEMGGGVPADLEKIKLNLQIAELEKRQLESNIETEKESIEAQLREEQIQMDIESHNLRDLERKLELANIEAKRRGVLTWANDKIGASVQEGEVLARIADLESFKVLGTCSDLYADQLRTGMPVIVSLNDIRLEGMISNIRPTIENNILTFEVQLKEDNHPSLRPNMKAEVFVVTASKDRTIRVENGPAFNGRARQYIFVLNGEQAERREVEVGLTNFDYVEITRNIAAGETVIISDLSDYERLPNLKIK